MTVDSALNTALIEVFTGSLVFIVPSIRKYQYENIMFVFI